MSEAVMFPDQAVGHDAPPPPVSHADPAGFSGQQLEAGLVAWQARMNHDAWRRACWLRETARARADTPQRRSDPDPRIIAAALGWSVSMATARLETADGVLVRLPRLGEAMRTGRLEEAKATRFVVGCRDLTDPQAAAVVDALIDRAPRLGVWELEQAIAAAVTDVDPLGAQNRRNAAVARARLTARTAPSGAAEIHGHDLDPAMAVPAFERILTIAEHAHTRLRATGDTIGRARVQAQVYLRLLHGCPDGADDLTVLDHVVDDLTTPPPPDHVDDPDGPDPEGPGDGEPDDDRPDDDGPAGPDEACPERRDLTDRDPGDRDPSDRDPSDRDPGERDPDDRGPNDPDRDRDRDRETPRSAPGWQPGDPVPDPPPPDSPDPRLAGTGPGPAPRMTERGLGFQPSTLRTTLATVLGLARAHGRLPHGALTGWDAHHAAWTRTHAHWRLLLYTDHGDLDHVLLINPPHPPGADPRYRRHVVELTAHTNDIDTLDPHHHLIGIWAELAHRARTALARARARPPDDHPAHTSRDGDHRFPGAELTRWIHARDHTCRFPMSTVPAPACHIDHTHDWHHHGPTHADNLGALSVSNHLRKHDPTSGWTVHQPRAGTFVWTAPTGTHHTVEPDPYRPLAPIPRERYDHGITDTPWRPRSDRHGHTTRATIHHIHHRRTHPEPRPDTADDDPPF